MPDNRAMKNRPAEIDPEKVKKLRELTGEGMMDCKKALYACDGDIEQAQKRLEARGNIGLMVYPVRKQTSSSYAKGMRLLWDIWNNWSAEDKFKFMDAAPITMHSTLGEHLRNQCGMWNVPWLPEIRNNLDCSQDHPDAISQKVIRDIQAIVKDLHTAVKESHAAEGQEFTMDHFVEQVNPTTTTLYVD